MTPLQVAVLAESETDDTVAREIVAHVRRATVQRVDVPSLRTRGWPAILRQLPAVVRTVFHQRDANALVVLADSDATEPHDPRLHSALPRPESCRWCALDEAIGRAVAPLRAKRPNRTLHTAVGTPVPALEAWLLAGNAPHPSEASWRQRGTGAAAASVAYKQLLKKHAYGSSAPRGATADVAERLIRRALAESGLLAAAFPGGYGTFEAAIRAW